MFCEGENRKKVPKHYYALTSCDKWREWLLFGVEVLVLGAVITYTVGTFKLHKNTTEQLELYRREMALTLVPRLSLGATDSKKDYFEFINGLDGLTEEDRQSYIRKGDKKKMFYYFRNISPNTAFNVVLIRFSKKDEGIFKSTIIVNQVLLDTKMMTHLEEIDKAELGKYLKGTYGWDVLAVLNEKCVSNSGEWPFAYVLIYADYMDNLYACRRLADVTWEKRGLGFDVPRYYELGGRKDKNF